MKPSRAFGGLVLLCALVTASTAAIGILFASHSWAAVPESDEPLTGAHSPTSAEPAAPAKNAAPLPPYQIRDPYRGPGQFRKAALHVHTANSFDGDKRWTPEQTARAFKEAGYTFLVYTDHDVISRFTAFNDASFVALSGFESSGGDGHLVALFAEQTIDARLPIQVRINALQQSGALLILAHPSWDIGYSAERLQQLDGFTCIEIYNHLVRGKEGGAARNIEKWQQLLNARGPDRPVWAVAVNDTHAGFTGGAWTAVKTASVNGPALREALLAGRHYATTGPEFQKIGVENDEIVVSAYPGWDSLMAAPPGLEPVITAVRFVDQNGTTLQLVGGGLARYRPSGQERWIRVEATDSAGRTAWSQPFFILPRAATGLSN